MLVTPGPLTAAGMPLQRVPNGFLAKRMRSSSRDDKLTIGKSDSDRAIPSRFCQVSGSGSAAGVRP